MSVLYKPYWTAAIATEMDVYSSVSGDHTVLSPGRPPVTTVYDGPADSVPAEALRQMAGDLDDPYTQEWVNECVAEAELSGELPGPADRVWIFYA